MSLEFKVELRMAGRGEALPGECCTAFFLPGKDEGLWLQEIVDWQVDQSGVVLYPIGKRTDPGEVRGCLVRLEEAIPVGRVRRAIVCIEVHGRLFAPWPAIPCPAPTARDVEEGCPSGLAFWHPVEGWVRLDEREALRMEDLLVPPAVIPGRWNRAKPGLPPVPRLMAVEVRQPEGVDTLLEGGRGDIGRKGAARPPGRTGGRNPWADRTGRAREEARRRFFEEVRRFAGRFPEREGPRTWVNDLDDWAARNLERQGPDAKGDAERLLDLLRRDPDEGLRYAVPLGEHGAKGRGEAPPGSAGLGRRDVDFDLSRLFGGGGRNSSWTVPGESYVALHVAYRGAANRELNLGRHRRAAYILAHLLGDYGSAAQALEQGQHFREAALLYEKKLGNARMAARCYEEGGLFGEAVRIYEEVGNFPALGKLQRALGREEEARRSWERAVEDCLERKEYRRAGQWLKEELGEQERALEVYRTAWPRSREAGLCLQEELAIYGAGGDWEGVLRRVGEVRGTEGFGGEKAVAVRILAEWATVWQGREVGPRVRDEARLMAAELLERGDAVKAVLQSLPELRGDDEILRRDVRRFERDWEERPRLPAPGAPPEGARGIEKVVEWDLPADLDVMDAAEWRGSLAVVGRQRGRIRLGHLDLAGKMVWAEWAEGGRVGRVKVMGTGRAFRDPGNAWLVQAEDFLETRFLSGEDRAWVQAGNEFWHGETLGFGVDELGRNFQVMPGGKDLVLRSYEGRELRSTRLLSMLPEGAATGWPRWMGGIPMVARRDWVYLGVGSWLARVQMREGKEEWMELPGPVRTIAGTRADARLRLVVGYEGGQAMVWGDQGWSEREFFGEEMNAPGLGFTAGGLLVAADWHGISIYAAGQAGLRRKLRHELPGTRPVAVLPGTRSDQFRVVRKGKIEEYRVTER